MTLLDRPQLTWQPVCPLASLVVGRGVSVLVDGQAVALFRLADDEVRAVDDLDPCSGAPVLSRGLVGHTTDGSRAVRYVASPLRKQRFDLDTGRGLDDERSVATWPARVDDGVVVVARHGSSEGNGPETAS